jgi:hypothetical protein
LCREPPRPARQSGTADEVGTAEVKFDEAKFDNKISTVAVKSEAGQ